MRIHCCQDASVVSSNTILRPTLANVSGSDRGGSTSTVFLSGYRKQNSSSACQDAPIGSSNTFKALVRQRRQFTHPPPQQEAPAQTHATCFEVLQHGVAHEQSRRELFLAVASALPASQPHVQVSDWCPLQASASVPSRQRTKNANTRLCVCHELQKHCIGRRARRALLSLSRKAFEREQLLTIRADLTAMTPWDIPRTAQTHARHADARSSCVRSALWLAVRCAASTIFRMHSRTPSLICLHSTPSPHVLIFLPVLL
jgi:hypothetical protein